MERNNGWTAIFVGSMNGLVDEYYGCPSCEYVFIVWRKKGKLRGKSHKKYLYCPQCNREDNFVKI